MARNTMASQRTGWGWGSWLAAAMVILAAGVRFGGSVSNAGFPTLPVSQTPAAAPPQSPAVLLPFRLEKGDHICIIGNTLADRMQHDGWLETFLHARFPQHNLTIRNLGYSGDEITVRLRSQDFGTPDQWLAGNAPIPNPGAIADKSVVQQNRFENTNTKADVIFAFFGYNESWAGKPGLAKFKQDLEAWIKHTLSQKYNGKSAPRLVLFSPIPFEDHKSPNLPTGAAVTERNQNLEMYSKAMGEVAAANGVKFVDLFTRFKPVMAAATKPLTINGVHLTEEGNRKARIDSRKRTVSFLKKLPSPWGVPPDGKTDPRPLVRLAKNRQSDPHS